MTKDQLTQIIVIVGILAGAIQQFYALKSDVAEMKLHYEYTNGRFDVPKETK